MSHKKRIDRLRELGDYLDESDAQLYLFFQVCPAILCITDKFYFRRVSQFMADYLGYTESELLAKPWASFVHPDDMSRTLQVRRHMVAGHRLEKFDTRVRHKGGRYSLLHWTASPYTPAGLAYSIATVGERGDG